MANTKSYFKNPATRHYTRVVAFAIVGAVVGAVMVSYVLPEPIVVVSEVVEVTDVSDAYVLPKADPLHLRIPSVNIDTVFGEPLGLNEDQTIEVPDGFEEVGWYRYGPTPGEIGPAVVLGHVDSFEGPAVFFSLGQLEKGDEIYIDRADGTTATFTVSSLERHRQSGFPTKKVYSDLDHAGLRLITCTGSFDRGKQVYSHNLIVFAELKEEIEVTNTDVEQSEEAQGE